MDLNIPKYFANSKIIIRETLSKYLVFQKLELGVAKKTNLRILGSWIEIAMLGIFGTMFMENQGTS